MTTTPQQQTNLTLSDLARRLDKNKSTLSRHCARLGLGLRTARGIELTAAEVEKLAGAIALARPGNPAFRR